MEGAEVGDDSTVPDSVEKPNLRGEIDMDLVDAKMQKRLSGSLSWEGFFKEFAQKMALVALLLLVVWALSLR